MRIFRGRIEPTAKDIVTALVSAEFIEIEASSLEEVYKDVEAVMHEYIRVEREIIDRAKDIVARQGLDYGAVNRIKRNLAKDKRVGLDDDALDYLVKQTIEALESSGYVEEIFGEDHELNKVIAPVLKTSMAPDEELDTEVRKKLKHISESEGSRSWEIEYKRIKEDISRLKNLD
jgi:uncharacterized protein